MELNIYYMQVDVAFSKALTVSDSGRHRSNGLAKGFVQEFGYTASSVSDARAFVEQLISKELEEFALGDAATITFDWIGIIKEQELEDEVYSDSDIVNSPSFANPTQKGLWYKSGRAFYE